MCLSSDNFSQYRMKGQLGISLVYFYQTNMHATEFRIT